MPITITITDPATIEMLAQYQEFIRAKDDCEGTIDQVAEGLMLGYLDEHDDFVDWTASREHHVPPAPLHTAAIAQFPVPVAKAPPPRPIAAPRLKSAG